MSSTALLIGTAGALEQLERQLDLLPARPRTVGWILAGDDVADPARPVAGPLDELEAIVADRRPAVALVAMPAVMKDAVTSVRTRLRRLGVPDRFMPTLEDQLAGVGPRTHLDIDLAGLLDRPARALDDGTARRLLGGRRVLVTGAGGTIGSALARIIAAADPALLVLMDRSENALFEIDRQVARFFPGVARRAVLHDVVEAAATLRHCARLAPEIIFHAAAHKHVPMMEEHPAAALDNNLFGTRAVADAADAVGAERFVMISTDKAVHPTSIMGATKRLAELYVQHMNRRSETAFALVRFGNVLGSSGSVLDVWSREIAAGGPVTVTHPAMTRYFMTIDEAAALVIEAAGLVDPALPGGEVFVLDMGEPIRILDLAQRFIRRHGLEPVAGGARWERAAASVGVMPIVFTGPRPGEKLHEQLALDAEERQPTRHPDIDIWMLPPPPDSFVREVLGALAPERRGDDPRAVAAAIRRMVPEPIGSSAA